MRLNFNVLSELDEGQLRAITNMDSDNLSICETMIDAADRFQEDSSEDPTDVIFEIAGSEVPTYNADIIAEFAANSSAWSADLEEMWDPTTGIIRGMAIALEVTYESAFSALLEYVRENSFFLGLHSTDDGQDCPHSEQDVPSEHALCPNGCSEATVFSMADASS
jgi:hypothetical protein